MSGKCSKHCVTRACVKMFPVRGTSRRVAVLFRRGVRLVSGGCCWVAIHSACSASLSHSRTSSSKPALRIGSRFMTSLQRQVGLLAIPLRSRQHANRTCQNQSGSREFACRNRARGAALFQWTLDFSPSPVSGSRDPALRSPPVAGFRAGALLTLRARRWRPLENQRTVVRPSSPSVRSSDACMRPARTVPLAQRS